MRHTIIIMILLFTFSIAGAQNSRLKSLTITRDFFEVSVDKFYRYLSKEFKLKIIYDTAYFQKQHFTYLFSNTDVESAIQISLQNCVLDSIVTNIKYNIKDSNTIQITSNTPIINVIYGRANSAPYIGPAKSYNFTLSGVLKDITTGEALPFGAIVIKGTTLGTATNSEGFFTLIKVPSDTATLLISYLGYVTTELRLSPQLPKKNLVIEIEPGTRVLNEITIKTEKESLMLNNSSSNPAGPVKISPRRLAQLPNIGEKDIMRSFQLMPGVSASNESSAGMYVRGGTPDQNLIIYDGFTVYYVEHMYGFFSSFNANAVKDVQLYKGGYEARFGGRISSVTEITGKTGNQKNFNLGGDISLLSFNLFTEIPLWKKVTVMAAYRRSFKTSIYNKIFDQFNKKNSSTSQAGKFDRRGLNETEPTSYFYDVNTKVTYRPSDRDNISVSFFNGTDNLDNGYDLSFMNFSSSKTDLTKYGNLGASVKWSRKWSGSIFGSNLISYSNYYSLRDQSNGGTTMNNSGDEVAFKRGTLEDNDLKDYSFKSDYQWDILSGNQIQFGSFATIFDINYSYTQNDTINILNRKDQGDLAGVYLQDRLRLWKGKITIIPGIRLNYYDVSRKFYYEPRLALSQVITEKLSCKFAYGLYYQFANRVIREDILSGSRDFWILSNDNNIPVTSSIHYIAGLNYDTKKILYSVEAYYKDMSGLAEYSLRFVPNTKKINYNEYFYNGTGIGKGIEFLVQKKSGNFNGWVSYTLGRVMYHFNVYSNYDYLANQDVTHEFKIVGFYKLKRWDFSATWVYATGRPYTAPAGAYSVTLLDGKTIDYFTVTSKNSQRLPAYHRMDLAVTYKLLVGEGKERKDIGYIGITVFNLYNRTNVWYKNYQISDSKIVETNVNYLGFTPNIVLSLKLR
jgi:ferric enterobactin receptor